MKRTDSSSESADPVDVPRVFKLWAPLAASWILMALEPTLVIAAISRLPDERVNLAAWSSIVFPVSLVVEGPIIMMLAASTRLSSSWARYRKVMRYGHAMGGALTLVHAAIAFTPLFDVVAIDVLGSDPRTIEPGRVGLMLMLPWTFAIGYRRAQQGALIRFERSGAVGQGTLLRLIVTGSVLFTLSTLELPGVVVAALGVSSGVTAEALFAGYKARGIHARLREARDETPLDVRRFARFYVPLAMTPLITLMIQPIGAAAMNRMPRSLDSLATWGPVHALVFTARSVGMAFNEVVVTLIALRGGERALKRFGAGLAAATSAVLLAVVLTPLAEIWFGTVQGIEPDLTALARLGVGVCVLMPAYQVAQSWFQGLLVHAESTGPITEAVALYFGLCALLLWLGSDAGPSGAERFGAEGLAWTLASFVLAGFAQTGWLLHRSRGALVTSRSAAAS